MSERQGRRELVVVEYVSLDGVVQAPGHVAEDPSGGFMQGGWTGPWMADHRRYNDDLFQTAGGFLLGRLTYDIWADYWPTVTDEHDQIATALNANPKYVASTTLEDPAWAGTTVIRDLAAEVPRLKQQPGKPILVLGSASVAQSLAEHGLVDEYQLWVHPVVLGAGKRLFADGRTTDLRLLDSRTTAGGLCILTFETEPAGGPQVELSDAAAS
jgi:dihydrofolate reductase